MLNGPSDCSNNEQRKKKLIQLGKLNEIDDKKTEHFLWSAMHNYDYHLISLLNIGIQLHFLHQIIPEHRTNPVLDDGKQFIQNKYLKNGEKTMKIPLWDLVKTPCFFFISYFSFD